MRNLESYRRYLERRAKLESRIAEERRAAAEEILLEIRYCVREFGFSPEDIFAVDVLRRATKRRPAISIPLAEQRGQGWVARPNGFAIKIASSLRYPISSVRIEAFDLCIEVKVRCLVCRGVSVACEIGSRTL